MNLHHKPQNRKGRGNLLPINSPNSRNILPIPHPKTLLHRTYQTPRHPLHGHHPLYYPFLTTHTQMPQEEKEELRNLSHNSPRLLNQTQLAAALGVTIAFTSAMKKWSCPFPGGRILIKDAHAWLKANPEFRPYKECKASTGPHGIPQCNLDAYKTSPS